MLGVRVERGRRLACTDRCECVDLPGFGLAVVTLEMDRGRAAAESCEQTASLHLRQLSRITDEHELAAHSAGELDDTGELASADHASFVEEQHPVGR